MTRYITSSFASLFPLPTADLRLRICYGTFEHQLENKISEPCTDKRDALHGISQDPESRPL